LLFLKGDLLNGSVFIKKLQILFGILKKVLFICNRSDLLEKVSAIR